MKNKYFTAHFFFVLLISLASCSSKVDNSITFKNMSSSTLYVNFRGEVITISEGETKIVKEIPKGTYEYSTTYSVPPSTISSGTQGAVSGQVILKAGTKILVLYSSNFVNGVYTLYATISNSDDLDSGESLTGP
jgi:hypothetical protein